MEYPIWLVVLMGLGIVFFGLVCIIVLSTLMSAIIRLFEKKKTQSAAPVPSSVADDKMSADEKGRIVAAISCAVAEELGTGVEAIRIKSIKKV